MRRLSHAPRAREAQRPIQHTTSHDHRNPPRARDRARSPPASCSALVVRSRCRAARVRGTPATGLHYRLSFAEARQRIMQVELVVAARSRARRAGHEPVVAGPLRVARVRQERLRRAGHRRHRASADARAPRPASLARAPHTTAPSACATASTAIAWTAPTSPSTRATRTSTCRPRSCGCAGSKTRPATVVIVPPAGLRLARGHPAVLRPPTRSRSPRRTSRTWPTARSRRAARAAHLPCTRRRRARAWPADVRWPCTREPRRRCRRLRRRAPAHRRRGSRDLRRVSGRSTPARTRSWRTTCRGRSGTGWSTATAPC